MPSRKENDNSPQGKDDCSKKIWYEAQKAKLTAEQFQNVNSRNGLAKRQERLQKIQLYHSHLITIISEGSDNTEKFLKNI